MIDTSAWAARPTQVRIKISEQWLADIQREGYAALWCSAMKCQDADVELAANVLFPTPGQLFLVKGIW